MSDAVVTIMAKQAITDLIYRYCRAVDRMDRALLMTVFHPTAKIEYPYLEGSPSDLADWLWAVHGGLDIHSHQVTNILIELGADASTAVSESYVIAALWRIDRDVEPLELPVAGGQLSARTRTGSESHVRARYLDRWSLVDGQWAIDRRQCVIDLMTITSTQGLLGKGRRDHEDPLYELL